MAEAAALCGVHSADESSSDRSAKLQKEEVDVLYDTATAHAGGYSYCSADGHDVMDYKTNCISDGARETSAVTEVEKKLEKYDTLLKWVEKNGGFMRYHSIQYTPRAGMGVIAGKDIKVT